MRERERDYIYPALRLIQVLPGHPWQIPKMKQCHHYNEGQAYESTEREQSPRQ